MAGEHAGHRQRMRERFLANGLDGFAPHEMLELLLFYAIPQRNVNPLAHRLLESFGSLHGVMSASVEELSAVEGMGPYAATLVSLCHQLARHVELSRENRREVMKNRSDAETHCIRLLKGFREERLYAVCLNAQMEILSDVLLSEGTVGEVPVYMREIADAVLRLGTRMVVLCHNHPGGSLIPSPKDIEVTQELGAMLRYLDIPLADHIIVAGAQALSMSHHGLIQNGMIPDGGVRHAAEMVSPLVGETLRTGKAASGAEKRAAQKRAGSANRPADGTAAEPRTMAGKEE